MTVKLLTEHNLEVLSLKRGGLSLHMSKCHIVGNHCSHVVAHLTFSNFSFRNSISECQTNKSECQTNSTQIRPGILLGLI